MNQPIENRVIEMVAEILRQDKATVSLESRFLEDLGANSLDVVELICLAEGEFGIRITESKIAEIRTVADVIYVITNLA